MERIATSRTERDKLEWLKRASGNVISQREAAEKIGVSERWVRKLLERMKKDGNSVVVHGLRGRASNRKVPPETQRRTIELLKHPDWHDFGPTFASQQLAKRHGIAVSDETVRGWMIEAGLWKPGGRRVEDVHFWRPRRRPYRTQFSEIRDLNDLEIGHLYSMFGRGYRIDTDAQALIRVLREMRNRLAHFNPVDCRVIACREVRPFRSILRVGQQP